MCLNVVACSCGFPDVFGSYCIVFDSFLTCLSVFICFLNVRCIVCKLSNGVRSLFVCVFMFC